MMIFLLLFSRYCKIVEWMDMVEMAIQKVCASKVYTSAEFKREKDNFHVSFKLLIAAAVCCGSMQIILIITRQLAIFSLQSLCKNLERVETKKW